MNAPYGLEVLDSCLGCRLRSGFCCFSEEVARKFNAISHHNTYPDGAVLFLEGQAGRGAYVLCRGKVKLSTTSREGKVLILRIGAPGEVLGLSAVLSNVAYEVTAEATVPCQVNFVGREALLDFLARHGEAGLHAARSVSKEYQDTCKDIQEVLLAPSSAGKLAKLLLSWSANHDDSAGEVRVRSVLTHEEMAQMIGSSRETVTRVLSDLRKKQFIRLEGSTLVIRNRMALELMAS